MALSSSSKAPGVFLSFLTSALIAFSYILLCVEFLMSREADEDGGEWHVDEDAVEDDEHTDEGEMSRLGEAATAAAPPTAAAAVVGDEGNDELDDDVSIDDNCC